MTRFSYASGFNLYENSPQFIKNCIGMLTRPLSRSFMLGRGFHEKLKFLIGSEKWNYDQHVEFQEKKLGQLMDHVYKNVPYYHEMFKINNLYPTDIRKIGDLKKLNVLTKDDVRNNFSKLVAVNYKDFSPGLANSFGTTGVPLDFYLDQQNREIEYASMWRQAFWSGIRDINLKIATFRGDMVFEYGKTNKLYVYNGITKELIFNTYMLDKESVKIMIKKLNEYKPELIKGYPHALYIISRYMEEENIELEFKPLVIQTSSEQLTIKMVESIEKVFNSLIFDWYSQSEYVISMGQCRHGIYHQTMETGILETIEDEYGYEKVYGTGLWNYSMPFIRYDIGDIIKTGNKCECGMDLLTIKSLEGRTSDMIIAHKKIISGVGFEHYWEHRILNKLNIVPIYVHFLQESVDKIIMEIYSKDILSKGDEDVIRHGFELLFEHDIVFEIKYLNELPTKKWRFVESKVKL